MPQPDASALRAFTRHCHDAFFRAILSDSERANALIHAHWPKALRWMLEGEHARPIDPSLVHVDLRQTRADKVYLVGGTRDQPNAVAPIEHISSPGPDVPRQVVAGLRGLGAIRREGHALGRSVRRQHKERRIAGAIRSCRRRLRDRPIT